MKKYILALAASAAMAGSMTAIVEDGPNRLLVVDQYEQFKGYDLKNVKSVEFATVMGEVAANLKLLSANMNDVHVSVTRTPECPTFKLSVIPGVMARQMEAEPAMASSYMDYMGAATYSEDFADGAITGMDLEYDTEYAVATLGIDVYGVDCDFRAVYFTTEKAPILGNPQVDVSVVANGLTTIDLKFTPNADTREYYFCIFDEGQAQEQFESFGAMMGLTSIAQMIKAFGQTPHQGTLDYQYKSLEPNTKYELYVLPIDKNGNMAELQIYPMETQSQGGSGDAKVEILAGEYKLMDWNGEMLPSQFFTFTPNDQTWCYRLGVYYADNYDQDPDTYINDVMSEPPVPNMANWYQFATISTDFQINPETTVVVIAAAKNADGVWGEPTVLRHTTPATVSMSAPLRSAAVKIATRLAPVTLGNRAGYPRVAAGIRMVNAL